MQTFGSLNRGNSQGKLWLLFDCIKTSAKITLSFRTCLALKVISFFLTFFAQTIGEFPINDKLEFTKNNYIYSLTNSKL